MKSNLLGEDFLQWFRCHWHWESKALEINGENIPFKDNIVDIRSSRVIALETIWIPAKHEVVVKPGLAREVRGRNSKNVYGVLSAEKNLMKNCGLALARVLVNASQGIIYARLFNPTSTDLVLYKGTHMALFVPVVTIGDDIAMVNDEDVYEVIEPDVRTESVASTYEECFSEARNYCQKKNPIYLKGF